MIMSRYELEKYDGNCTECHFCDCVEGTCTNPKSPYYKKYFRLAECGCQYFLLCDEMRDFYKLKPRKHKYCKLKTTRNVRSKIETMTLFSGGR